MRTKLALCSLALGIGVGAGLTARKRKQHRRIANLTGQVVLITGSSRGLGLAIAQEFARQGAHLILCARQDKALELARQQLAEFGGEVLAISCDVRDREQVQQLIEQSIAHFGHIDILINNAGIITVGPQQTMTEQDYADSMNTMFWGTVYPTLAVLPSMRAQHNGRIVNITSIGGKVSVPHLLPYSSAKFATIGFSEGLHAELAKEGIWVTTVVPGLMRTGSHINAFMKGKRNLEYTWFGLAATLPLTSISIVSAARQIMRATCRGDTEVILTPHAQLLARFHGLFPALTTEILSLAGRFLPDAGAGDTAPLSGRESRTSVGSKLTQLGEPAAHAYNQYAREE